MRVAGSKSGSVHVRFRARPLVKWSAVRNRQADSGIIDCQGGGVKGQFCIFTIIYLA